MESHKLKLPFFHLCIDPEVVFILIMYVQGITDITNVLHSPTLHMVNLSDYIQSLQTLRHNGYVSLGQPNFSLAWFVFFFCRRNKVDYCRTYKPATFSLVR